MKISCKHIFAIIHIAIVIPFHCFAGESGSPRLVGVERSRGTLQFKINGQLFNADATHARGYAAATSKTGFINGANANNMLLNLEMEGLNKTGHVVITTVPKDKCLISINHTNFFIQNAGDYIKVTITSVKQSGGMLLLTGSFEGKLHDNNGNEAIISDGIFSTDHL